VHPPAVYEAPPKWEPKLVWKLIDQPEAQVRNDFHRVPGHTFPLRGMPFQGSIYFFDTRGEIEEIVPSANWAQISEDGEVILTRNDWGVFKLWKRSGEFLWELDGFDHGALSPYGDYAVLEDGTNALVISQSGDTLAKYDFGIGRPVFSRSGDAMFAKVYREFQPGEGIALFDSKGGLVYIDIYENMTVGGVSISGDGSRTAYLARPILSDMVYVRSIDSEGLLQWEDSVSDAYYGCQLSEDGGYLIAFGMDAVCYDNWTGSVIWEYGEAHEERNLFFEGASAAENPSLFALTLVSANAARAVLVILEAEGNLLWRGVIPGGDYFKPRLYQHERLLAINGNQSFLLYDLRGLETTFR
jgi:hypothetical protein